MYIVRRKHLLYYTIIVKRCKRHSEGLPDRSSIKTAIENLLVRYDSVTRF